jgi:hypothetical protein
MGRGWEHFMDHGARLVQPDVQAKARGFDTVAGWLWALEQNAKLASRLRWGKRTQELPNNPWRQLDRTHGSWVPDKDDPAEPDDQLPGVEEVA